MLTSKELHSLLPSFIDYLSSTNSSRSTIKNYTSDLKTILEKLPADLEIGQDSLNQAVATLGGQFSESTLRRFGYSLKSFCSWLNSKGYNLVTITQIPQKISDNTLSSPIEVYSEHIKSEGAASSTTKLYTAGVASFFAWLKPNQSGAETLSQKNIDKVSHNDIERYISYLRSKGTTESTIQSQLYSLKSFFNLHKEDIVYETNPVTITRPVLANVGHFWQRIKFSKPRWWHAYRGHPMSDYVNWAASTGAILVVGLLLFEGFFAPKPLDITNLKNEIQDGLVLAATPPRILSFQGRLTDLSGNPTTIATNIVFRIYTSTSGDTGDPCANTCLWESKTWSVTPDANGIFSVQLGDTGQADTAIPSTLFADNSALYLGVKIGADAEAAPRQRIASSSYALNSDSLDGIDSLSFLRSDTSDSFSSGTLTVDDGTALTVNSTTIGIGNATGDTITVNGTPTFNTDTNFTLAGTENIAMTSDLAGTVNVISLIATPNASDFATQGLFIQQAAAAGGNGLDVGIAIDNADTDLLLTDAISITNTGAFGNGYSNFLNTPTIDITGAGAITGATALTSSGAITFSSMITDANAVLYTTTGGVVTRVVETETGSQCLLSGAGASGVPVWGACPGGFSGEVDDTTNDSLTFTTADASAPSAVRSIYASSTNDLMINVTDGGLINLRENDATEYSFSDTTLDFNANTITDVGDITATGAITIASAGAGNDVIINGADILDVQDATTFASTVLINGTGAVGGAGVLDVNTTSATDDVRGIDNSFTSTDNNGGGSYGVYNSWTSSTAFASVFSPQNDYGIYNTVSKTGIDTAGGAVVFNLYGIYSSASNTSTGTGTRNTYGGYFDATGDTNGTTTAIGLYLADVSGANTNVALCFDCDGAWASSTVAAGIQFGTDTNLVTLYRSASDTLKTDDNFVIGGTTGLTFTGASGDITFTNGEKVENDTDGFIKFIGNTAAGNGTLLFSAGQSIFQAIGNVNNSSATCPIALFGGCVGIYSQPIVNINSPTGIAFGISGTVKVDDSTGGAITLQDGVALEAADLIKGTADVITNAYGVHIDNITAGGTKNIGLCFDCLDGTFSSTTVSAGIQWGTDANSVNLYRNGSLNLTSNATTLSFASAALTVSSCTGCGGGGGTLQQTYDAGAAGDQLITLDATQDSIVITNPTSAGTSSAFTLQINQNNTTAAVLGLDLVQASNAANGINLTANAIDGETALAITTNGLTSGKGITVSSSAIAFTGSLTELVLSGSNAANTGSLLKLSNTGTANTNTSLYVDHRATGTGNMALRIDDVASDTTPFIIDGDGRVGVGTISITGSTERLLQIGSPTNRGNASVYGEIVSQGYSDITALTGIKDIYVYDTTADSDGGRWIDWATTDQLSWYNETLDDGPSDPCVIATDDRCYAKAFPRKAILIVTTDSLYIFDAATNDMWMKFSQNAAGWALGADTNNDPSSVTALNGVIYVGAKGTASGGLYAFDFVNDRMWNYDATDRAGADVGISGRNGAVTYASDAKTALQLDPVGTSAEWMNINDVAAVSVNSSLSAITIGGTTNVIPGQGLSFVALATDSGVTIINLAAQKLLQYSDVLADNYEAVALTKSGKMYALNSTTDQAEKWDAIDSDKTSEVAGTYTSRWTSAVGPALAVGAVAIQTDAPDALEVVERGSLAQDNMDLIYVGHSLGLTEIHDNATVTNGWSKFYNTTRQTMLMPNAIDAALPLDETSGTLAQDASFNNTDMSYKGTFTLGASGVRGKGVTLGGAGYLCSDANADATCDNDASFNSTTTAFNISMWFKHSTTAPAAPQVLYEKCYNTTPAAVVGCVVAYMTTTGTIVGAIDATTTFTQFTTYDITSTSSLAYNDDQWHFLLLARDNVGDLNVYIDGQILNSTNATPQAGTVDAASQVTSIVASCAGAANCATGANFWDGSIDDFTFSSGATTVSQLLSAPARRLYNDARPLVAKRVITVTDATTVSSSTIGDSGETWIPNEFSGMIVTLTGGTGVGQTRRVVSNTTTTLTVSSNFATTPDTTTDFEVDPEALYGASDTVTAVGVTAESPLGEARQMCIGTNDTADGGGVTCYNHQAGPNLIADLFHSNSAQTDDYAVEWTGTNYDDIRSIDLSGRALLIGTEAHIYAETRDVRLGQGLDYLANQLFNIRGELIQDGIILTGSQGLEVGFTGGADLAEYYYSDIGLDAGTLVSVDTDKTGEFITATDKPYQNEMLGIVSTEPGLTLGQNKPGGHPVALSGRVPLRVTTNNGADPIKAGDYLTSSGIPGVAMKAKKAGFVIGMALEDFPPRPGLGVEGGQENSSENPVATGSATLQGSENQAKTSDEPTEDGKVLVFVNRTWFVPSPEQILETTTATTVTLDQNGDLIAPLSAGAKFVWENSTGQAVAWVSDTGEALFSKVTALVGDFGKLVFGEAVVKKEAKTAGEAIFAADATEVFIESDKVTEESLINLTASTKTNGLSLYIKEKKVGEGFVVALERSSGDQPDQATASATTAIKFTWFILNQQ